MFTANIDGIFHHGVGPSYYIEVSIHAGLQLLVGTRYC